MRRKTPRVPFALGSLSLAFLVGSLAGAASPRALDGKGEPKIEGKSQASQGKRSLQAEATVPSKNARESAPATTSPAPPPSSEPVPSSKPKPDAAPATKPVAPADLSSKAALEGNATGKSPQRAKRVLVHRTAKISYGQFVRKWHEGNEDLAAPVDAAGRPYLILHAINANERVSMHPTSDSGTFSALDLDRASSALRDTRSGNRHPMEPRLLDILYRAQVHFGAPEIRVVSGYRTAHGKPSNHSRGRAVDFVVPGVSDADVARFARDLGFVGVGIYPASGFVHVDVRHRSYFWVDASGPGRRNRERGILGDLAKRSDAAALARGARGLHPFFFSTDVDSALRSKGLFAAVEGHGPDDDDDDDDDE